jgi:Tfp pilus assembly protein PilE
MDNFNYQAYIKSGRIHGDKAILTESEQVSEKKYKQGYDDREDESLGARRGAEKGKKQSMKDRRDDSYGKFGKRDAEKKGKNKINKESLSETIAEAKAKIDEGSYPFDQCLADNEGKYGKKGAAKVCGAIKAQYGEGQVNEMDEVSWNDKNNPTRGASKKELDPKKVGQSTAAYSVNEDARTDAEQEGYKDGFEDAKDDIEGALKKMKVSELKDKIKTEIHLVYLQCSH